LHQRTPLYIGSKKMVAKVGEFLKVGKESAVKV